MAECDCCHYESDELEVKEYEQGMPKRKANLCILCAKTLASDSFFYPQKHGSDFSHIMQQIAYTGNVILHKISENQSKKDSMDPLN